jgi:hypothetical protein
MGAFQTSFYVMVICQRICGHPLKDSRIVDCGPEWRAKSLVAPSQDVNSYGSGFEEPRPLLQITITLNERVLP